MEQNYLSRAREAISSYKNRAEAAFKYGVGKEAEAYFLGFRIPGTSKKLPGYALAIPLFLVGRAAAGHLDLYGNGLESVLHENGFDLQNYNLPESDIDMFYKAVEVCVNDGELSNKDVDYLHGFLDSLSKAAAGGGIFPGQAFSDREAEFLKDYENVVAADTPEGGNSYSSSFSLNIILGGQSESMDNTLSVTENPPYTAVTFPYEQETGYPIGTGESSVTGNPDPAVSGNGDDPPSVTLVDRIGPGEYVDTSA